MEEGNSWSYILRNKYRDTGRQAVMGNLFGGLVPSIDLRTSLNVNQSNGVLSINGTISGNNFPNHEIFVSDAAGNSVFLGQFTKPSLSHPLFNLPGSGGRLGSVNVQIQLDDDGNFTRAFFIDRRGNECELEIFRP